MKTLVLAILTLTSVSLLNAQYCGFSGPSICSPSGTLTLPGLSPSSENLPPLINGYPSSTVIQFKNFDTFVFSGQNVTVSSLSFDTIEDLPPGLCWSTNKTNNTFANQEDGCLSFNGTVCAPPGQYKLYMVVTANIGVPIQTNADAAGMRYFLRVKNAPDNTIPVDTNQTAPFVAYGNSADCSPVLSVNLGTDQTVCGGSTITLNPVALGGVEPYTYSWSATAGTLSCTTCEHPQVTISQTGTYTVTVIDASGASATDVITYTPSGTTGTVQIVSLSGTGISCATPTDVTSISVSGGTLPLNYNWGDGSTTSDSATTSHSYQQAGAYVIAITDANGCVTSQVHQVAFNGILITAAQLVKPNCTGMNTGLIQVNATGGTAPYTYNWSNGGTVSAIAGISAGNYYVTVTDNTGCSFSKHFNLPPLNNWAFYPYLQASGSNCSNNGYVTNTVYGGIPPYTYLWNNGSTSQNLTSLSGGTYTVTVTDSAGCNVVGNAVVSTSCYSIIEGNIFNDSNSNCSIDSGEGTPMYIFITATSGQSTYYGTCDANGYYNIQIPAAGTFNISVVSYGALGCSSVQFCGGGNQTVTIPTIGDTISNNNFGLDGNSQYDLFLSPTWTSGNPGFTKTYNIYYGNTSYTPFTGTGTVTFKYDSILVYQSSTPPAAHNLATHTLTWTFNGASLDSIFWGEAVHSTFLVPIGTSLSTMLQSEFNIAPTSNDCNPSNNQRIVSQDVTGSFDPNEKKVTPAGGIYEADSVLTYTIGFQNTGTDSTHFIILKDTLSPYLDASSVRNLASSHPYTEFTISGAGILTWAFNPLRLVDSFTNEPESHGFVMFSIKKKPNLPIGTVINNTAHIYFDYNEAVVTNTVTNTLSDPNGITTLRMPNGITVTAFPNPFTQATNIAVEGVDGKYDFELYDITGKLHRRLQNIEAQQFVLQRGELGTGMYFFKVLTANGNKGGYGKLMIE